MDFDDLIYHTVKLLQNDEEARRYYQDKFKYVVVDEYQDTSIAQFNLVRLLAGGSNNVCVVGDDDQSIYKFRGATIENILNFEQVFNGGQDHSAWNRTTVPLPTSSMPPTASSKTTQAARARLCGPRTATAKRSTTTPPPTSRTEASHLADIIGEHLREGAHLRDHAVLYRMNAQSNPIETYFARRGHPVPHRGRPALL